MLKNILKKFSGNHYRKYQKKCSPIIEHINTFEVEYQELSDEQLRGKVIEFRDRYKKGEDLDKLLPEAFAVVKNGARRLCGQSLEVCGHELPWEMVHYDVQLLGGIALHQKRIAEMATGEGKTLVSTCPLYLNALTGRNCQLVTVNDYLARRDSEWMGHLFRFLGLTVGCIQNGMTPSEKRQMYDCDITYGTASEFGFDYLRDNGMASRKEDQVQRDHFFCIIDEVDSILIDEARTPLIISGPMQEDNTLPFKEVKPIVQNLVKQQQNFCNNIIKEVKLGYDDSTSDEMEQAIVEDLYKVKLGMPKHKQLLRLIEDPRIRKSLDKIELELNGDFKKEERVNLKESLYYILDEKQGQADLTEKGRNLVSPNDPDAFMLPDLPTIFMEIDKDDSISLDDKKRLKHKAEERFQKTSERIHCISQLLRAYSLYEKDKEYVIQNGRVNIVDQNTGRVMPGRRWSDGLHQAVEAKENCNIQKETKTYASVTIQNYFRMYDKISGMTGTAETEASEFHEIYGLAVMVIPTHRTNIRKDNNDVIYKTRREKYSAVLKTIIEVNKKGQPVLVGTSSVESSELLSRMLKRSNIVHSVLNAKYHQQEAEIVSRAGQKGAVTIATNMAGRGTDIKLGREVSEIGGLFVLGTERHESRRVDRQLRGRCARQGDPGISKFFVSLEDDLMRLFANAGPISKILEKNFGEDEELEHPMLNWSIENAQKKVEQQNFSIRKRLLQFDDVLNTQREVIYSIRNEAITSDNPREVVVEMIEEEIEDRFISASASQNIEDLKIFIKWVNTYFPITLELEELELSDQSKSIDYIMKEIEIAYSERESFEDSNVLKSLERYIVIRALDKRWQDHLTEMEELRRSVSLRSYGQKDPLNEYKSEAFLFFEELMSGLRTEICTSIFRTATNQEAFEKMFSRMKTKVELKGVEGNSAYTRNLAIESKRLSESQKDSSKNGLPKADPIRREIPKVGRNEIVTIVKDGEEKQLKFKRAEILIENEGWSLISK